MKCDADEPTATTTAGGAFTLTIPSGVDASTHAIVVQVSEATVDEDTGAAVGKPYVLSAPAGESDFISPITTVVHGMLQQNPALTLDDAVTQVKLRIGASSDVSLFEDYVAAEEASNAVADDYERLHRIAQVAASDDGREPRSHHAGGVDAGRRYDAVQCRAVGARHESGNRRARERRGRSG